MEIYDIIMLVIIVGAALFGAVKGFAWQLASIASIVVSYIVAYKFREPFSHSIHAEPPWDQFLAMLILFIGTSLVIWVLFRMVSNSIDRMRLREFDRQVGFLFGAIKGFLYATLITLFAVTLMGQNIRSKIVASKSGKFIAQVLDRSDSVIPEEIHYVLRPYLDTFDQRFAETQDTINSGYPDARETTSGGFFSTLGRAADTASASAGSQPASEIESFWNRLPGMSSSEPAESAPAASWGSGQQSYQRAENPPVGSAPGFWQR
ncbi:CvpA family protein [Planctomycetes bacterium K23_9]|uniref:Colicin V production protein n=1 Tax=Stieleria marina TaxID=1930275 RepID=A0A517NP37_9BACT|nr:Colicin V production protein [Planctomycetes bacterium K23_9]